MHAKYADKLDFANSMTRMQKAESSLEAEWLKHNVIIAALTKLGRIHLHNYNIIHMNPRGGVIAAAIWESADPERQAAALTKQNDWASLNDVKDVREGTKRMPRPALERRHRH